MENTLCVACTAKLGHCGRLLSKDNVRLTTRGEENGNRNCFSAIAQILNNVGRDKVSQVFLGALNLLQTALVTCKDLMRGEVTSMLGAFTIAIVEKVGDSNGRVRQEAQSTLMKMAQATCLGPPYVSANILRKPKKQHMTSWRPVLGRLSVLRNVVMSYGLGPTSGLSLDACMEHAKISNAFMHPNNNVRVSARDLCVALHGVVGDDIMSYLGGLREAVRRIQKCLRGRRGPEWWYAKEARKTSKGACTKEKWTESCARAHFPGHPNDTN